MLKLNKLAVTGGLSCGKSSVCRLFKELGATVVSADEIVHQLLSPQVSFGQQVIELIGSDIVVNGQIDRSRIAKKVFDNQTLLYSLEKILHPAVKNEIEKRYQNALAKDENQLFVAEVPLLFESDLGQFDAVIAVIADYHTCKQRFEQSTGCKQDEFDKRMSRQLSPEEKAKWADFVICNDGSFEDLRQAVDTIYKKLTNNIT
jgi:dephospho-CoA kinase